MTTQHEKANRRQFEPWTWRGWVLFAAFLAYMYYIYGVMGPPLAIGTIGGAYAGLAIVRRPIGTPYGVIVGFAIGVAIAIVLLKVTAPQ